MTSRAIALALGLAYALLTAAELLLGELSLGGVVILDRTTKTNLLHWSVALALLGSFFAGVAPSRVACRIAGSFLMALAVWGLLSAVSLGGALGYSEGIPGSYQVLHALSATAALIGGFVTGEEAPRG